MKSSELISVIIPVYNAASHIDNIISDLINQTYHNLEIILVDDGSEDGTKEKLERYSKLDNRINVVFSNHGGPSKARNIGLDMAKGKYIRFIDADDRIPLYSMELMFAPFAQNPEIDLVIGNYSCNKLFGYYTGTEQKEEYVSSDIFANKFVRQLKTFYFGVLWNKMYRTELVEHNNIRFDENLIWCEDLLFNIDYYEKMRNAYFVNCEKGIYEYHINSGSITNTIFSGKENNEEIEKIDKIRDLRLEHYFELYGFLDYFHVESENAFLYSKMNTVTYKKETRKNIKEQYRCFCNLFQDETITQYMEHRIENDNSRLWKKILRLYKKKRFFILFIYIYYRRYLAAIMRRIPNVGESYFEYCYPKEL